MKKKEGVMPISKRGDKWYWGSKGPFDSRIKAEEVAKAAYAAGYIEKDEGGGAEGDGIDGLNGVVFTSSNSGIFTRTHGGHGAKKHARKNKKRADKKRRTLLGKKHKSGVERLEDFLEDYSPTMKKAVNKRVDGMGQEVAHNPQNNPMRIDYKKLGADREIGKANEPNSSMSGLDSRMDMSTQATKPQDEDPSISMQVIPKAVDWNGHNSTVQKAGVGGFTNIAPQPDQNLESGDIASQPQKPFIERQKDPNKVETQDVKMNDVTTRVKKDMDDEDAGVEQPLGVASAAASQITKQWGSGSERGEYRRSEEGDEIPSDEQETLEESESARVIEALQALKARKQRHIEKGETHPLFLALMDEIDAV